MPPPRIVSTASVPPVRVSGFLARTYATLLPGLEGVNDRHRRCSLLVNRCERSLVPDFFTAFLAIRHSPITSTCLHRLPSQLGSIIDRRSLPLRPVLSGAFRAGTTPCERDKEFM